MTPYQILVIEDDDEIRRFLIDLLHDAGYVSTGVGTGAAGLAHAAETTPDLVFLDWDLPDQSGGVVASLLRGRGIAAPIVVISASFIDGVMPPHPDVAAFVAKPFHVDDLLHLVGQYCPARSLTPAVD